MTSDLKSTTTNLHLSFVDYIFYYVNVNTLLQTEFMKELNTAIFNASEFCFYNDACFILV